MDIALVVITAPVWLAAIGVVTALLWIMGQRVFFTQERIGRDGRTFRMFKFCTMLPDSEARLEALLAGNAAARAEWESTQKLKCDPRVTRTGRFLRKTSLDELPQLINVLWGDMSLVGPRPMMVSQDVLYTGSAYYRLRPGITGLWQISDRNDCTFVKRADYDAVYEREMSIGTDLRILMRTVAVVLRGTGY